ncbi:MAG: glycogen debranching enzyme N-terminal domain-containing protein [Kiritimatiellae bacterium]|nr:glycogen debranching enzyme N-terminal domain-containing protein [Kiritimatiellia bacterium]
MNLSQSPQPGEFLLRWAGDVLEVSLVSDSDIPGRAMFRTNIGRAAIRRRELIDFTECGEPILARDWHDIPMEKAAPGRYTARIPLLETGIFSGKACFFPVGGDDTPVWPEGENLRIKVEPAHTAAANTMYTAFVRQFGANLTLAASSTDFKETEETLSAAGYTVIPPSGTFRDLKARLDDIMREMGFGIIQLLPIFPVPTTFARMGRFGSAFAARDFLSVDPALAEFDRHATPLDQFRELVDAVHARNGTLFLDLPANHTGWAATMQTHHPEWYRRQPDGGFASPGAWGVTWEDLVELDYRDPELRAYMAEVFLFWCRQGVDGFRCDAGYMIPAETWGYIVARVRESYPDTVFMLEGLGGKVETTRQLLSESNLDWAYSELFQTYNREAMEWYLPQAIELSETCGPLIHFAETHDNNRLAANGAVYAQMRVQLSALLSHCGAFGIANGVEWLATEKIDVHGASALNWGSSVNLVEPISRLNRLLSCHPAFGPGARMRMIQTGGDNVLAVARQTGQSNPLLVLVNLECGSRQRVHWHTQSFPANAAIDLLTGETVDSAANGFCDLEPGQCRCLSVDQEADAIAAKIQSPDAPDISAIERRRTNLMAMQVCQWLATDFLCKSPPDTLGADMTADPVGFCARANGGFPNCVVWNWPTDTRRQVPVPNGSLLLILSDHRFRAELSADDANPSNGSAVKRGDSGWMMFLPVAAAAGTNRTLGGAVRKLTVTVFTPDGIRRTDSEILALPEPENVRIRVSATGCEVREDSLRCQACNTEDKARLHPYAFTTLHTALSNPIGAMAYTRAAWGEVRSQYDCLLGINPDPKVPADKMVFWTSCRAWLRFRGYSHEIDESCLTRFCADPAGRFADWIFDIPCGMGKRVALTFRLELAVDANLSRLTITRQKCTKNDGGRLADSEEVTVVLRPDVEWRSFHDKTKAYAGAEQSFPAAVHATGDGFSFTPPGAPGGLGMRITGGAFHQESQWRYMCPHPEEFERGLGGDSDCFSPGWFELPLTGGAKERLLGGIGYTGEFNAPTTPSVPAVNPLPLDIACSSALSLYIVNRDALKTVIAGYPWFLDWGRDTLIVLRGMIADGRTADALAVLREFGRFEQRGMLPNIIHGNTVGNWDTSDAPLWFCVAAGDLAGKSAAATVFNASCGERSLRDVVQSILENILSGTPNGVKADPDSGLAFSPPHFTWMDTNYPAGTPREGYPVEIQALWIAALRLAAKHIDPKWTQLADKASQSLSALFPRPGGGLHDCLRAKPNCPASGAEPEDTVRPNQLLTVTLDVLNDRELAREVVGSCGQLLIPGAIRSLADLPVSADMGIWRDGRLLNNPHAPYAGHYRGDEDTLRKPAYHNGTAWSWMFPLFAEALFKLYGKKARNYCGSLLTSAAYQMNRGGCLCHIAEIFDGDSPHFARGCAAQAWGMSELLRVWKLLNRK